MKGPVGEEEDLDEMGSPQGSLQAPGSGAHVEESPPRAPQEQAPNQAQQPPNEGSSSPEALLAEDERSAENAVGLQDDAQACCIPLFWSAQTVYKPLVKDW
jgi:hypothetical protein